MADRNESSLTNSSTAANVLTTKIDPTSARFEANMRFLADLMSQVRNEEEAIREGGGSKAIESQHGKGRLTARERIERLIDPGTFFELGVYAAHGMYEEWGGAPPHSSYMPCAAYTPNSKKVPGSINRSMRSRAVRRPLPCWLSMALLPPPSRIASSSFRTCDIRSARKRMLASKRAEVGSIFVVSTFAAVDEFVREDSLRSAMVKR